MDGRIMKESVLGFRTPLMVRETWWTLRMEIKALTCSFMENNDLNFTIAKKRLGRISLGKTHLQEPWFYEYPVMTSSQSSQNIQIQQKRHTFSFLSKVNAVSQSFVATKPESNVQTSSVKSDTTNLKFFATFNYSKIMIWTWSMLGAWAIFLL